MIPLARDVPEGGGAHRRPAQKARVIEAGRARDGPLEGWNLLAAAAYETSYAGHELDPKRLGLGRRARKGHEPARDLSQLSDVPDLRCDRRALEQHHARLLRIARRDRIGSINEDPGRVEQRAAPELDLAADVVEFGSHE